MEQSQPPEASKRKSNKWLWLAVLLVAAMLIIIVDIFMFPGTIVDGFVTGAFIGTPQSQADGCMLTFGIVTPETKFADCKC